MLLLPCILSWLSLTAASVLSASTVLKNSSTITGTTSLFRRADASYRGRDCKVAVLIDDYYLQSFAGTANPWEEARSSAMKAMSFTDRLYRRFFDVGLPVAHIAYVGPGRDEGSGLGQASATAEELLSKLQRAIDGGQGMFRGLKGPNMCLVHLVTYQNFGLKLGTAYVAEPGTGGVCDRFGYNAAISNTHLSGKHTDMDMFMHSLAHEIGHNLGSPHDGQMPANLNLPQCAANGSPFLMDTAISSGTNRDNLSECSQRMIWRALRSQATCFVQRGTAPYLQYQQSKSAPATIPSTSPPSQSAPIVVPDAPVAEPTTRPDAPEMLPQKQIEREQWEELQRQAQDEQIQKQRKAQQQQERTKQHEAQQVQLRQAALQRQRQQQRLRQQQVQQQPVGEQQVRQQQIQQQHVRQQQQQQQQQQRAANRPISPPIVTKVVTVIRTTSMPKPKAPVVAPAPRVFVKAPSNTNASGTVPVKFLSPVVPTLVTRNSLSSRDFNSGRALSDPVTHDGTESRRIPRMLA